MNQEANEKIFMQQYRKLDAAQQKEIEDYMLQLIRGQHARRMPKEEYQKLTEEQKLERKKQIRREWAAKHREEINAKRRAKYAADPGKRAAAIQRAKAARIAKQAKTE